MSAPAAAAPRAPVLTDLDGVPFLDDTFRARRLLALTAAVRHCTAGQRRIQTGITDHEVEAWLAPSRAYLLGAGHGPMPALPLPPRYQEQVTGALAGITALMPAWEQLTRLPVRYAALYPANGAISASSTAWPQHILLADDAFATGAELREQLVHELAHQWLYLIQAIWPLDIAGAPRLTLPSGTRGRTPAEVIGAAHVAAALLRLYGTDQTRQVAMRTEGLSGYGTVCLELAGSAAADLTPTGILIAQRLKEAF
jgi:hypothetical protein